MDRIEKLKQINALEARYNKMYAQRKKAIEDGFTMVITDWMLKLELKPYELYTYALIYQFSKPGSKSYFTGTAKYIHNSFNCSQRTAENALSELAQKELITKEVVYYGSAVKHTRCAVSMSILPNTTHYIILNGWMFKLNLTAAEILIYAVIFRHSSPGSFSIYTGGIKYLKSITGLSERSVKYALKSLHEKRHIFVSKDNGYHKKAYEAIYPRAAVEVYNQKNSNKEGSEPIEIIG